MPAIQNAIVIGGGIGGLSTAIALSRVGIPVRVFEKAPELRELGAGLTVWTNAMAVLRQLGVDEQVVASGCTVESMDVLTSAGRILGGANMAALKFRYPSVSVHRRDLLHILATAAQSYPECIIELGQQCTGVRQDANQATVTFADGREESADLVIAADGINSFIRSAVVTGTDPLVYAGYTCYRGVAQIAPENWDLNRLTETVGKGSRVGLLNVGGGRIAWYATLNSDPRETYKKPPFYVRQDVMKLFANWHSPIPEIIEATPSDAVLMNDIYDRDPIKSFFKGRICLLGDAAHPTTPNLGQGAGMSMEDAVELADCCWRYTTVSDALAEYDHRRVGRAKRIVLQSRMAGQFGQLQSPLGCMMRNWVMKLSLGGGKPPGWDWLMHYHPSELPSTGKTSQPV